MGRKEEINPNGHGQITLARENKIYQKANIINLHRVGYTHVLLAELDFFRGLGV